MINNFLDTDDKKLIWNLTFFLKFSCLNNNWNHSIYIYIYKLKQKTVKDKKQNLVYNSHNQKYENLLFI